jgi:CRP-like cAMP-binding protein
MADMPAAAYDEAANFGMNESTLMNPLAKKLSTLSGIDEADVTVLADASKIVRGFKPGAEIIREGDSPSDVHVILSGLAARFKTTAGGQRQIFAYLLPGDFCDLHVALLDRMDHDIGALADCEVAFIPRSTILALTDEHPRITRALWMCNLVDEAVLREWLVNVGQRDALHRIAHLFCEIHARLAAVDLVVDGIFSLPMPQTALADTVGLSDVHVSRSLKTLRAAGLADFKGQIVTIPDIGNLRRFAEFDPAYLHLSRPGAPPTSNF